MKSKKLTKEDLDKVRRIEGFPIGKDEDIIALSDAPYYTACPNPFVADFIAEHGTPYDEATDDYHREPFAADVSEGKTDPIYMGHTYHTKVPHKAIMRYIMHYTNPGDIVFDGFCGTGMTALAAQLCETPDFDLRQAVESFEKKVRWGKRHAIVSDLSPVATFIAHNYTSGISQATFYRECQGMIDACRKEFSWMYETIHDASRGGFGKGTINYVVWSDKFICPSCSTEFVFWDAAIGDDKEVKNPFACPHCGMKLKKSQCARAQESIMTHDGSLVTHAKQVPSMINYSYLGKKLEKRPDEFDLQLIEKAHLLLSKYNIPSDELPDGDNTAQPMQSHNFKRVNEFYYDRSAVIFAFCMQYAENSVCSSALKFLLTSVLTKTGSKLHNIGFKNGKINLAGAMPNVLYVPSTVAERNIIELLSSKVDDIMKVFSVKRNASDVLVQCCSAINTGIIPNSIDYIFTDPPFGANINYSELNYIWESWLRVKTNNKTEAIMNNTQKKALTDYQDLMSQSFTEYYRILKPGRWMTVEFHNSMNSVWNAIQEALLKAGFIIADIRILDKKQGTFKQMTTTAAVKQDLVISAYKPKESFQKKMVSEAGTPETAWEFVRQHLEQLPVVVMKNEKIELISERQAFLLFDRMVAYHIMKGIPVPVDATDFYRGLDEKFLKRDGMYFLLDQVNEYDTARIVSDVEPIQMEMFVTNEKSAIAWLYQQLSDEASKPQTYAEIQPKFMQEISGTSWDKNEAPIELKTLLEENFLQDEKGHWYIPDVTKEADVAKLREKKLLKEFEGYLATKGKLKLFRAEAIRVGFAKLWADKNYKLIVETAERLPEKIIQEDDKLLMYYDISLGRA